MGSSKIKQNKGFHIYTMLLMVYFAIAPLEDVLANDAGSWAKYLAILIIGIAIVEKGMMFDINLNVGTFCLLWLLILSVISTLWAIDYETSMSRIPAYLTVPGLCLFVSILSFSELEYKYLTNSIIVGGIIAAVYIYITNSEELLKGGRIVLNDVNDPNNLAALLLLPLAFSMGNLLKTNHKGLKAVYITCIVLISPIFLLTGSRGGLLSALIFLACYVLFSNKGNKFKTFISICAVIAILAIVVIPMLPENIYARLFSADEYIGEDATGSGRTEIWEITIREIVPENILIGVGAGCAPVALIEFFGYFKGVHNIYLNMLCEYGLLGLPFFLIMLFYKWREQYRLKQYVEAALLVSICAVAFFLDAYPKKFFWNVLMILAVNENLLKAQKTEQELIRKT